MNENEVYSGNGNGNGNENENENTQANVSANDPLCFKAASKIAAELLSEIKKVVLGKENEAILLICALLSSSHVLIEDVPGVGKTTLASALAKAAGLSFKRVQFTPDVMASDITGFNIYNRQKETFEFREGVVMSNVLLADEINRASPKTQSALLEAMEEGRVTVDGDTYALPSPFMVIATQNPQGFVGTYPLPEAQLDRFALKISLGYPTEEEELLIIKERKTENPLDNVKAVSTEKRLVFTKKVVSSITIDDEVLKYIISLVSATRGHSLLSSGASPRASLALMRISRAYAFMNGRNFVRPEDVKNVYKKVLAHRITLSQEAKLAKTTADAILNDILMHTPVPYKGAKKGEE